jgi:hypothetical protein
LVFAIDEASAALSTLGNYIVSETALAANEPIKSTRNIVFEKYQRGLLTVIVEVALLYSCSIIAVSPCVDVRLPSVLSSGKGKKKIREIRNFKPKKPSETDAYMDRTVNLSQSGIKFLPPFLSPHIP